MTPLRQSINSLNDSIIKLPNAVFGSVQLGMREAFADKLDAMFNVNASLAEDANLAVRQLNFIVSALCESGQDFVQAAESFRNSNFAESLSLSVEKLHESREQLTRSTDGLSGRLDQVGHALMVSQQEWKLLAKTAEQELSSCRIASQQIQQEVISLKLATSSLDNGTQITADASKQLKEARLEVMRDRKLALEISEAVRDRLATDSSTAESCQVFAHALKSALTNWNCNVERLDELNRAFMETLHKSRLEDANAFAERSHATRDLIDQLGNQLREDLAGAIKQQQDAVEKLLVPTTSAKQLSQDLLKQLGDLKAGIESLGLVSPISHFSSNGEVS
jgi:hypothetical protein